MELIHFMEFHGGMCMYFINTFNWKLNEMRGDSDATQGQPDSKFVWQMKLHQRGSARTANIIKVIGIKHSPLLEARGTVDSHQFQNTKCAYGHYSLPRKTNTLSRVKQKDMQPPNCGANGKCSGMWLSCSANTNNTDTKGDGQGCLMNIIGSL